MWKMEKDLHEWLDSLPIPNGDSTATNSSRLISIENWKRQQISLSHIGILKYYWQWKYLCITSNRTDNFIVIDIVNWEPAKFRFLLIWLHASGEMKIEKIPRFPWTLLCFAPFDIFSIFSIWWWRWWYRKSRGCEIRKKEKNEDWKDSTSNLTNIWVCSSSAAVERDEVRKKCKKVVSMQISSHIVRSEGERIKGDEIPLFSFFFFQFSVLFPHSLTNKFLFHFTPKLSRSAQKRQNKKLRKIQSASVHIIQ